nr:hypothetical protein [Amycolatopsis sp. CA-128772]
MAEAVVAGFVAGFGDVFRQAGMRGDVAADDEEGRRYLAGRQGVEDRSGAGGGGAPRSLIVTTDGGGLSRRESVP